MKRPCGLGFHYDYGSSAPREAIPVKLVIRNPSVPILVLGILCNVPVAKVKRKADQIADGKSLDTSVETARKSARATPRLGAITGGGGGGRESTT
jgi:hypothetical protein